MVYFTYFESIIYQKTLASDLPPPGITFHPVDHTVQYDKWINSGGVTFTKIKFVNEWHNSNHVKLLQLWSINSRGMHMLYTTQYVGTSLDNTMK